MRTPRLSMFLVLLLAALGAAAPASAAEKDTLVLGLKFGAAFGQPFGPFGAALVPELEAGYVLPFLDGALAAYAAAQYVAPVTEGTTEADARLPGDGQLRYEITHHRLALTLGALYRLEIGHPLIRPYATFGPQIYLTRAEVDASGGLEAYGANQETATELGLHLGAGTEIRLGPGSLLAEVQLGWAPVDRFVLRQTSTGLLDVFLGYRLGF